MIGAALPGLGVTVALALVVWAASLWRRDASLVDRFWPLMIVGAGWAHALALPADLDARDVWLLLIASAWALRLALYITWRNWGHGEDRRYQAIRARNQPGFAWKSLVYVFALQALLAWIVSAPLLAAMAGERPVGPLDVLGLGLALFGFVFEAVADAQMARFKADPAHRGQVMDQGLWGWSRHPNYFGEACVWWGFALVALSAGGLDAAWSLVSPLLMTVLLLKVSGVRLLEQDIGERRPAYRDYIERTSAFWPMPPQRRRSREA